MSENGAIPDPDQIAAIGRAQAVIAFEMNGTIVTANENFLRAMGYTLAEIQGKHHSMFVDPSERDSAAYRDFWAALKRGEYQAAEYKRNRASSKDQNSAPVCANKNHHRRRDQE